MKAEQINGMQQVKCVIFSLNQEEYGFDIMAVNGIEPEVDIKEVPNAPSNILGIINLRDEVIPVYSLRKKFNLPDTSVNNNVSKLIITKSKGISMAYEVDKVIGVFELPDKDINDVPGVLKTKGTSYMKKIAKKDGNLIILLDQDKIIDEQEYELINDIKDDALPPRND